MQVIGPLLALYATDDMLIGIDICNQFPVDNSQIRMGTGN